MSNVIALIPARVNSRGIVGKNWRYLGDKTLIGHAAECALEAGIDAYISTDHPTFAGIIRETGRPCTPVIRRPAELANDTTPMLDVVRHAMQHIPGDDDQVWLLLQPTQPFRTPAHLREAVRLLRETRKADSVVSVVEVPIAYHAGIQFRVNPRTQGLQPYGLFPDWEAVPKRRQALTPTYKRDGTVYAFWRRTVGQHGSIYGQPNGAHTVPLIIPPEQSCELDTEADWQAVEKRWREHDHP